MYVDISAKETYQVAFETFELFPITTFSRKNTGEKNA